MSDAVKPKKPGHTLADHAYGADALHVHEDGDHDHDHDDFGADVAIEDNPIWLQDNLTLTSVGIDIGSAGTQVVFSRLENPANLARIKTVPATDAWLASLISVRSSFAEVKAKCGL